MTTYKWTIYIYIKVFDTQYKGRVQSLAVCAGTENFQRVGWGCQSALFYCVCSGGERGSKQFSVIIQCKFNKFEFSEGKESPPPPSRTPVLIRTRDWIGYKMEVC